MTNDQYIMIVICGMMTLRALLSRQVCAYYLYKDCRIDNKVFYFIEKSLMVVLPLVVIFLYRVFLFHNFVIRLWMILIVLLDFSLQYLAKSLQMLKIPKNAKLLSGLGVWILFMIVIFLI